jgi:hypothetical protein
MAKIVEKNNNQKMKTKDKLGTNFLKHFEYDLETSTNQ